MTPNTTNKGNATMLLVAIVLIIIGLAIYAVTRPHGPETNGGTVSTSTISVVTTGATSTDSAFKTYTNSQYGFTFQYPAQWQLNASADGKQVSVKSGIKSEIPTIDVVDITVKSIALNAFGEADTKFGIIKYDTVSKDLADYSNGSAECMQSAFMMGVSGSSTTTVPVVAYGGSLMSDPVYGQFAVLTNKDYLIDFNVKRENIGNESKDAEINALEGKIYSSFQFVNGVSARDPGCVGRGQ